MPAGVSFGDVWFNAYRHLLPPDRMGFDEGEELSDLLAAGQPWNRAFSPSRQDGEAAVVIEKDANLPVVSLAGDLRLTLLSPTRHRLVRLEKDWSRLIEKHGLKQGEKAPEDRPADALGRMDRWPPKVADLARRRPPPDPSKANHSSIALLAQYGNRALILTADAHPGDLQRAISRVPRPSHAPRLRVDAFKLSHHGSRYNLTNGLLQEIACTRYLVSTSGRGNSAHPDHEALSRVLVHGGREPELVFNYDNERTGDWRKRLPRAPKYRPVYPQQGRSVIELEADFEDS